MSRKTREDENLLQIINIKPTIKVARSLVAAFFPANHQSEANLKIQMCPLFLLLHFCLPQVWHGQRLAHRLSFVRPACAGNQRFQKSG